MKIALIGTHGTGKTTLVYGLAAALKEKGHNAGIVSEGTEKCPFEFNCPNDPELKAQKWFLLSHVIEELEAEKAFKTVVCDRSVLDHLVYTIDVCQTHKIEIPKWYEILAEEHVKTYDFLFRAKINPAYLKTDGIRRVDAEWQKTIDDLMTKILEEKNVSYYWLPDDKKIEFMLEKIIKKV